MKAIIELLTFILIMALVWFILALMVVVGNISENASTRGGFFLVWLVVSVGIYISTLVEWDKGDN